MRGNRGNIGVLFNLLLPVFSRMFRKRGKRLWAQPEVVFVAKDLSVKCTL